MTLKRKIFLTGILLAFATCLLICISAIICVLGFKQSDDGQLPAEGSSQVAIASDALTTINTDRMQTVSKLQASVIDEMLNTYETKVSTVADIASDIYSNSNKYGYIGVNEPDPELNGQMSVQLVHSENITNLASYRKEVGMLGNMADDLYAICDQDEMIAAMYVASESGLTLQTDMVSASKLDTDGNVLTFETADKPWYIGARHAAGPYFNVPAVDENGKIYIICSVPFYANDTFAGVVCAEVYLEDIESVTCENDMGQQGFSCIVGIDDKVIFSSKEEGALTAGADQGIDAVSAPEFAQCIAKARAGENSVARFAVDNRTVYASFVYIDSTGWVLVSCVDEGELLSSLSLMSDEIAIGNDDTAAKNHQKVSGAVRLLILITVIALAIGAAVSYVLSGIYMKPIGELTKKVQDTNTDNPVFEWNGQPGDETFILADGISKMLNNANARIHEVKSTESDKGKLEHEQDISASIQTYMLPKEWPAFPDHKEFDIYASMNMAKEVGGDFYDYYMLNDNYLVMVVGDVSGTGVKAAVMANIVSSLIKVCAQNGDSPATILKNVNQMVCKNNKTDMFVTVWLGIMDISTGVIATSNAGHEYPVIPGDEGLYELDKNTSGPVIGVIPEAEYAMYDITLMPGQTLFVYTDGVREVMNASDDTFGSDRILEAINELETADSKETIEKVSRRINEFVGTAEQTDDITMLALHRSISEE